MQPDDIRYHNIKYSIEFDKNNINILKNNRIAGILIFEDKLKKNISGNILDLGAGNGYASIYLANNRNVKVDAVEFPDEAIKLLKKNIKEFNLEDKINILKEDFHKLSKKNHYDYVISFGSLHHAQCLFTLMESVSSSMKNGAFLIINEPMKSNQTSNLSYIKKYESTENLYGKEIKNKERNDSFFRECEYLTAAFFNSVDLQYQNNFKDEFFLFQNKNQNKLKFLLKKMFRFLAKKKDPINSEIIIDNYFIFKKNIINYVPHLWRKLK